MLDRPADPESAPPRRQPIINVPGVVTATLALLVGVHVARQFIPDLWDDVLLTRLAFVPGRITFAFAPDRVVGAVAALAEQGGEGYRAAQVGRFFLGDGSAAPWTSVSYALLHADWAHVGLNGIWLLAFGTPVARRFGAGRFVAFLIVTALAGALAQWAAHPLDLAPVIGASAAVSGCMGAALRFMFQPHVPVAASLDAPDGSAYASSARPLRELVTDRRPLSFLVAWFATNLLFGLGSMSLGLGDGPIAWEAHIGGFLAGLFLFRLFDPLRGASRAATVPGASAEGP